MSVNTLTFVILAFLAHSLTADNQLDERSEVTSNEAIVINSEHSAEAAVKNVSRATHPPYVYSVPTTTTAKSTKSVYDQHVALATHPPYPPIRKNSANQDGFLKKHLLKIDADLWRVWFKETLSYLAAPFLMPISITKAVQTPPGLQSQSRTIWSKIMQSLRSTFLKRSTQDLTTKSDLSTLVKKMKESLQHLKLWQTMKRRDKSGRRDDLNLNVRWVNL